MISAIVSITENGAIGKCGNLIVRNRDDMLRFKELTSGGTVIIGRKTFESFPKGALPNRRNIVLTRDTNWQAENIEVARSEAEALALAAKDANVWIIGGEAIYNLFLPHTERIYVTLNHVSVPDADSYFCKLPVSEWHLAETINGGTTKDGVAFEYLTYERA